MPEDTPPDHPLYREMGLVRIIAMEPEGRASLEYEAREEQCHSGGVVQGGFITGWIDAAMAHAAIAKNGESKVPMTLEMKVSFFAPARPGRVIAEGWVERHGRRTGFYEGHLKTLDGTIIAKATSTMMLADAVAVQAASKAAREGDKA